MQIDNLHEMLMPVFLENLSSAEFAKKVVKFNEVWYQASET